ncbi:hypothetical protein Vau01_069450 [Virgisporangium aurantiacum]|uniref:TROVE domain-containing protein n=1 Tax=Virgisporangium aurantiacum TaxID=175570 RepID=A0A8J3Z8P9_9ACTN|nr:hypothetical protein Vau01_069450 [Virgisporangium aurantiacum]
MSKFNRMKARARSPIVAEATPSGVTHEGGAGYAHDAKSELFLLAVANVVGEDTFYEKASDRDRRFSGLVKAVAVADPDWTARFLGWLRTGANMRSASLVGALDAAHALLGAGLPGGRQLVSSVLQRADEPGEALAYWTATYGRAVPKPVKRGVADAVSRLYNERSLLKYDTAARGFRFGDVIDLVHPTPAADKPWQGDLFKHAIDRRHGRDEPPAASLRVLAANASLRTAARDDRARLADAGALKQAGMTWEDVLSAAGPAVEKARLWEAAIPRWGTWRCCVTSRASTRRVCPTTSPSGWRRSWPTPTRWPGRGSSRTGSSPRTSRRRRCGGGTRSTPRCGTRWRTCRRCRVARSSSSTRRRRCRRAGSRSGRRCRR